MEKMTIERAIEILNPEHREHYESIEPVNEACIMGMEALKEKLEARAITVSDIDPLMPHYHVLAVSGRELGSKGKEFGYMKPEYDSRGRRTGGKRGRFEARKYKTAPPWLKLPVAEIRICGYGLGVYVKED